MPGTAVSFDSNDLQTSSIITSQIDAASIPEKDAKLYSLAHANASKIPFTSYPSKKIVISGKLIASSIANMDALEDTFKSYFRGTDKNLDIGFNGGTRRFIATVNSIAIDRPGGLQFANFTIEFVCTQPFGQATSVTTPSSSFSPSAAGRTSGSYTDAITFTGTAPYQLPVITITITAVTGGTGYLAVGNSGNNQGITITGQTFVATDVIEIDCKNKTVKKNGVAIDFLGAFPEFPPGAQSLSYSDGFTTRTFTIAVTYYPLYL